MGALLLVLLVPQRAARDRHGLVQAHVPLLEDVPAVAEPPLHLDGVLAQGTEPLG